VLRYLARRVLFALLLVAIASSAAFFLTRLAPGDYATDTFGVGARPDAVEEMRARYGLDRPVLAHYAEWAGRALRLDLGTSLLYGRPVGELVGSRLANTAILGFTALALATLVGFPLGVAMGANVLRWARPVVAGLSTVALSLPPLLTSLVLVFAAARTGWAPVGGMTSPGEPGASFAAWIADVAAHLPVPALALAVPMAALIERLQARATSDVMGAPHVTAALARGVSRARLLWRHLVPIAARPVVAVYGLVAGSLLSGSFAVEMVTAWPGLGRLMVEALRARDVFLVAGCATAGALVVSATNLAADLVLVLIDPRERE
jgi:peptide/nickel transport system permease protein